MRVRRIMSLWARIFFLRSCMAKGVCVVGLVYFSFSEKLYQRGQGNSNCTHWAISVAMGDRRTVFFWFTFDYIGRYR